MTAKRDTEKEQKVTWACEEDMQNISKYIQTAAKGNKMMITRYGNGGKKSTQGLENMPVVVLCVFKFGWLNRELCTSLWHVKKPNA